MAQIVIVAVMAVAALYKARQQKNLKMEAAKGLREAGGRAKAAAQREAAEEERLKEHMHSRALAVAAASGAGIDDPGMVNLIGDLNAEGEYRVLSRLWAGEDASDSFAFQAEQAEREGDAAMNAGYANAISTAASAYLGGGFGGAASTPITSGVSSGVGLGPAGTNYSPVKPRTLFPEYVRPSG